MVKLLERGSEYMLDFFSLPYCILFYPALSCTTCTFLVPALSQV